MKMMITVAAMTLGFAGTAFAHGQGHHHGDRANRGSHTRVSASSMSCSQVQSAVAARGSAIVYESADIYDRYVVSQAYCPTGTYTEPTWISTEDTDSCMLYRCQNTSGNTGGN